MWISVTLIIRKSRINSKKLVCDLFSYSQYFSFKLSTNDFHKMLQVFLGPDQVPPICLGKTDKECGKKSKKSAPLMGDRMLVLEEPFLSTAIIW